MNITLIQTTHHKTTLKAFIVALLTFVLCIAITNLEAKTPIVLESDPAYVSHKLQVKNVTIGLSDKGGGYLNYCSIDNGSNIVSSDYGKGWQSDIRDELHSRRYNPTQAGFRDLAGTPVKISKQKGKLSIQRFNMPLYGDGVFDFTENEDLAPDNPKYADNGRTDADGYSEKGWTQDDELRSEFDFQGFYEDVSHLSEGKIPIIRFYQEYIYARKPKAIFQFGDNAIKTNGTTVLNEKEKVRDISSVLSGRQSPSNTDLSKIIFTSYGARLLKRSGYTTAMRFVNGEWQYESFQKTGKRKRFKLNSFRQARNDLDYNFLILSKGKNPEKSQAIALYSPESEINKYQIIGRDNKANKISYKEDRRMKQYIYYAHKIKKQISMRFRYQLSGILSPLKTKPGIVEVLRNESYILFGTPNQILKTIQKFK